MLSSLRRLFDWFARQSRITKDLIVIGLLGLPVYAAAIWYDLFDKFLVATGQPESNTLDWLVLLFVVLGIAAKIFSVRRVFDLREEVALRRKTEAEAFEMARLDVLTGLPNRRWFLEDYDRWAEGLTGDEACALFLIDLDDFKPINDVYGHRLGDEVLKVVAKRLTRIAEGGSVARLGGDEFGIIVRYRKNTNAPERLARQIVHEVQKPIPLASLSLQVGVSVGVSTGADSGEDVHAAMAARDGTPVETALRQADMAMYWAKMDGRGCYRFFDQEMDRKLQQRIELESEIRGAIAAGQIVPYYQPIVDLEHAGVVGFEVLARWVHPTRGVLDSETFIQIAEDTGTINEMSDHLLEQAMHDAKEWPERLYVAMNFSPRQISEANIADRVHALLKKAAFPPHRLVIEITESAVVQRLDDAKAALQALRRLGVRIAIDDFGTGYSGLYHLREIELDTLKIDRSFVGQMLDRPEEARIIRPCSV